MTQAVLFDVLPKPGHVDQYFEMAAQLKPIVQQNPGFLSVERFANLQKPDWYLSFSCWKDEESLAQWRCQPDHNGAQVCGRHEVFADYRLRVSAAKAKEGLSVALNAAHSRELVMLLIGDYEAIQKSLHEGVLREQASKSYQGVLDPKRGLSVCEFPAHTSPHPDLLGLSATEAIDIHWFGVLRDYGMFDRAEAPTQFA